MLTEDSGSIMQYIEGTTRILKSSAGLKKQASSVLPVQETQPCQSWKCADKVPLYRATQNLFYHIWDLLTGERPSLRGRRSALESGTPRNRLPSGLGSPLHENFILYKGA